MYFFYGRTVFKAGASILERKPQIKRLTIRWICRAFGYLSRIFCKKLFIDSEFIVSKLAVVNSISVKSVAPVIHSNARSRSFDRFICSFLNQEGKDTGTARFQEGNTTVVANFRKKVDWDQDELAKILAEHPEYKDEIKCVLSLEERKYNNWPENLQKIFEPARSVKVSGYEFSFNNSEED